MADYFSFEDVMGELELSEEDLKRMVSEGELRAFRDENKMKFKREDVDGLRKGRITEPTIILPSTPTGGGDETLLDLDISEESDALADTAIGGMAPQTPTPAPMPSPVDQSNELVLDETELTLSDDEPEVSLDSDETFIEEDIDTGMATEPLALADEGDETIEAEAVTEEVVEEMEDEEMPQKKRRRRPAAAPVPASVEQEIEAKRAHWAWTIGMVLTFCVAAYSGFLFYDMARLEMGNADRPSVLTEGAVDKVLENFWGDTNYHRFHKSEFVGDNPPYETPEGFVEPDWYFKASYKDPDFLQRKGE